MPRKLPESSRSAVVQKWLEGLSRNKISAQCGVSQAAVSGIIDDWEKSVGVSLAEQYRDLALTLDRNGISVVQCAQGFRIAKLMSNLGIKEDEVEAFLGETYNRCEGIGLHPREIASHLAALVSFFDCRSLGIGKDIKDDQCNIPSISRIAEYLEDSKEEIRKQEQRIEHLKKEEESAEAKNSSVMRDTERILKEHNMTVEKLNWYSQLKTELLKSGHSGNDFAHLIKAIDWLRDKGYDLLAIVDQFSKHEALESSLRRLQVKMAIEEKNVKQMEERANFNQQLMESQSQLHLQIELLKRMGFDLKQLKRLYYIVNEILQANGFSQVDGYAMKKFFDDVERHYDSILGFKKQVEELQNETTNLTIHRLGQLNIIAAQPYVGSAIARLLNRGISEDQILKLAKLLEMHPEIVESYMKNCEEQIVESRSMFSCLPSPSPSSQSTSSSLQRSALSSDTSSLDDPVNKSNVGADSNFLLTPPLPKSGIKPNKDHPEIVSFKRETNHRDQFLQDEDVKPNRDTRNQVNPPSQTSTFFDTDLLFPETFLVGTSEFRWSDALRGAISEPVLQPSYHRDNKFKRVPTSESASSIKSIKENDFNNPMQAAPLIQGSTGNPPPRPADSDYALIETLPITMVTAKDSDDKNLPENVLDNNPQTMWSNKGNSWILVDLGSRMDIHSVKIAWYLGSIFDYYYKISLSTDGIKFMDVKTGCSGGLTCSPQHYILKARTLARFVKITVKGNNMNDMAGISQVEVLGSLRPVDG